MTEDFLGNRSTPLGTLRKIMQKSVMEKAINENIYQLFYFILFLFINFWKIGLSATLKTGQLSETGFIWIHKSHGNPASVTPQVSFCQISVPLNITIFFLHFKTKDFCGMVDI